MNTILCCERNLAKMAVRALYFEVKAYPKPGLVSFVDSGAHQDMNGETFYRSLFALRHYFYQISRQGRLEHSFEALKQIAINAEQRMLATTSGVNTHRGAIFALGLICVSAIRLGLRHKVFTPMDLHLQLLADWPEHLKHHTGVRGSHGDKVRQKYKVTDARQMAIQGYELVFQVLPAFISLFMDSKSLDASCLLAYAVLLVAMDDTNILYKKGKAGLDYAQSQARELLKVPCLQMRRQKALELHRLFSAIGISPGGVADLIAVLLFLGQLFCISLRDYSRLKQSVYR